MFAVLQVMLVLLSDLQISFVICGQIVNVIQMENLRVFHPGRLCFGIFRLHYQQWLKEKKVGVLIDLSPNMLSF